MNNHETHEIYGIFAFLVEIMRPYESLTFGRGGSAMGSSPSFEVGAGFEPSVSGHGSFLGGGGLNFSVFFSDMFGIDLEINPTSLREWIQSVFGLWTKSLRGKGPRSKSSHTRPT